MIRTYKMGQAAMVQGQRRFILLMAAVFIGVAGFLLYSNRNKIDWGDPWTWAPSGLAVAFFFAFLVWRMRGQLQEQRKLFESIRVDLGPDYIARQQVRIPEQRIQRDEVTRIQDTGSGLCIYTADKTRTLAIPNGLDGYNEIRSELATWTPLQTPSVNPQIPGLALLIVLLAGFGIIFLSSDVWLNVVAGIGLIGFYAYYTWTMTRQQGLDPKFRRNLLLGMAWIVFIIGMKLCALTGVLAQLLSRPPAG